MNSKSKNLFTAFLLLSLTAACSTEPKRAPASLQSGINYDLALVMNDSTIEISYVLGHSQHRFSALAKPDTIEATTYLDKDVLRHGALDRNGYVELVSRVSGFVSTSQRQPATAPATPCRNPYSITLRVGPDTQIAHGCRCSNEAGASLSHLAREAEFLLYSRNAPR